MSESVLKGPVRTYLLSLLGAILLYSIALIVSLRALHLNVGMPWKYAFAILPVLPALWIPAAAVRLFRAIDELQKRIQLEALTFGFVGSAVFTLTYGFLQNAGLPAVSWVWVWPVMATCWIIGCLTASRRYR